MRRAVGDPECDTGGCDPGDCRGYLPPRCPLALEQTGEGTVRVRDLSGEGPAAGVTVRAAEQTASRMSRGRQYSAFLQVDTRSRWRSSASRRSPWTSRWLWGASDDRSSDDRGGAGDRRNRGDVHPQRLPHRRRAGARGGARPRGNRGKAHDDAGRHRHDVERDGRTARPESST